MERMPAPLNPETAKAVEERKEKYILELKAQANKELVDFEERPLEKWLKSCEMLRTQMDLARQYGDARRHYIMGMYLSNLGESPRRGCTKDTPPPLTPDTAAFHQNDHG